MPRGGRVAEILRQCFNQWSISVEERKELPFGAATIGNAIAIGIACAARAVDEALGEGTAASCAAEIVEAVVCHVFAYVLGYTAPPYLLTFKRSPTS